MSSGDASGGVLVSPAPASMVGFTSAAVGSRAALGRLMEPELIALSSHGGHHLFINRIPPRLPKEDVEKIILAQLRLHPFVLQVSKCSVIPQNSLKNKGYGFITLEGSPLPSELDTIADSLNNKLQVGCRTLGVRVCTDCHSACYVEEDGCVSSSSSTPPNELADDTLQGLLGQAAATDARLGCSLPAESGGEAPGPIPDQPLAPLSSGPPLQLDLLQTAVAALAKQALPPGAAPVAAAAGTRRRKPGKQHDESSHSEHTRYQQQQSHGLGEGARCRSSKAQSGNGPAHAPSRQRRHTADASPASAASGSGSVSAVQQPQEGPATDGVQDPAWPCDPVHLPPAPLPLPGLSSPSPQEPVLAQPQPELQKEGGCVGNAAVAGSPRSVSSYSSASGSGPGSTSNSAPGSVWSGSGSGSGTVVGANAGGWCSLEGSAEPPGIGSPAAFPAVGATSVSAVAAAGPAVTLPSSASRPHSANSQPSVGQRQRQARTTLHGRVVRDGAAATSPPRPSPPRGPVQQQSQMPGQPSGSVARCSQSATQGFRATAAAAPMPAGPQGRAGRGQGAAAQRVSPSPPPALEQSPAWTSGHAAGFGPACAAHLHSASAPASSSWYIHQYHRHQHDQHRHTHQRQHHYQHAQGGASVAERDDSGGSGGHAGRGGPARGGCVSGGGSGGGGDGSAQLGGGGTAWPHPLKHPSQRAASGPAYDCAPCGLPRQAWADGANGFVPEVEGRGVEGRGSYPGAISELAARSQPPGARHHQQQLQHQQSHLQLQRQQQQPWQAPLIGPLNTSAQIQKRAPVVAFQALQPQQQPSGFHTPPPPPQASPGLRLHARQQQQLLQQQRQQLLQQQQQLQQELLHNAPSVAQPLHDRQQQLQQGREGPQSQKQMPQQYQPHQQQLEPQQRQQQQRLLLQQQSRVMSYMQQPQLQQPQQPRMQLQQQPTPQPQAPPALFSQSGGGSVAGRVHVLPSPLLQAPASGGPPAASPTSTATALPLQLLLGSSGASSDGFRVGSPVPHASSLPPSLMGWRTDSLDLEYELQQRRRPEALEPPLLVPAHAGGPLGAAARSGVSAMSAEWCFGRGSSDGIQDPFADSADSTDLDPLDLEPMILQLLENDDDDCTGCPPMPVAARRECADLRNYSHSYGQQVQLQGQLPQAQRQQHLDLTSAHGPCQLPPASAAPPALYTPAAAMLTVAPNGHHNHQQQPVGYVASSAVGAGMGAEMARVWALPRPCSDGSSGSSSNGMVGAFGSAASCPPASVPARTVAASGLGGPVAALHFTTPGGGLQSAQGGCPQQPPYSAGPPRERAPAEAPAAVTAAASVAAPGARWAGGRGACDPSPGFGAVGSFPGAGAGGVGGAGAGAHRRGGASSGGRATAGGGVGPGGSGSGFRGRHPGGGRGQAGSSGRVPGLRPGGMGGGQGGAVGGVSGRGLRDGGGGLGSGGGFELFGFVSGSLPNANLLAVMQRLDG